MQVASDVLAVLSRARTDGNALVLIDQLDRMLYERTNKVLEAAGGKWNRRSKAHLFDIEAAERIDQILLTGEVVVPKDEFNFFPTPPAVVDVMLAHAAIEPGMRVLEPSAGAGAIAFEVAKITPPDCIELMEANIAKLLGDMRLASVRQADFLAVEPDPVFDRVLANPPFGRQADVRHVLHALRFLKPDGLLVAVMSAGVMFRDTAITRELRDLIGARDGFIEPLPDGAFRDAGTMVRTVLAVVPGEEA